MSAAHSRRNVEYRAIPNFPGYKIGDDGSVLSCWERRKQWMPTEIWHELKTECDKDGYRKVRLRCKGKRQTFRIHRLVLERFVGPCPVGMCAAHNNGICSDNRLSNLRWDTRINNCADKIQHGTSNRGEKHGHAKLNASQVLNIRSRRREGRDALAKEFRVTTHAIRDILLRRTWKHLP